MRHSAVLFLILLISLTVFTQPPKKSRIKKANPAVNKFTNEKAEFESAINQQNAPARIAALQKFIEKFPASKEIVRAQELIVSARAQLGEDSLKAGDTANGIEFFKSAVKDAPQPMSERLFADVILQFPTNLFLRGQRDAAFEIAQMIEEKTGGDPKQLLGLATFYIGVENTANARRLAQKAIELAPQMPSAYQTLAVANRLGFRLDEAVAAYSKALELDPSSTVSKRSLAEMKRANGKTDEAIILYREILEKDHTDANAKTGLVLALFDSGKQGEAETEMQKMLESNPNNLPLLVGAAYFYAAHNDGAKAVDLAQKALTIEPRYTWANIALARGFLALKRPLDAERVLLAARNYGNFPTIDYEIATARLQAGFYREAAEELKKNFDVKNGVLETYLGNRVGVEAEDFLKLLSLERRAAIFSFEAADTSEDAERLKSLLEFSKELDNESASETLLSDAAEKFIKGDDKMKIHRQLFVAGRLLNSKKNLPKVIELTQSAVRGVDTALDVANPSAAVMADELYETRMYASSRGEVLIVPEVPRQTLSAILRGRIEELSGWTLYQQDKTPEAIVKLKRAVSVLPEKSSWWRSSVWRLGAALEADGKTNEALENYIKSYKSGEMSAAKYLVIESIYQKVNGNSDGLEEKIGKRPESVVETVAKLTENTNPLENTNPQPEITPAAAQPTPAPTAEEAKAEILAAEAPMPVPTPTPEISVAAPEPAPTPELATTPQTTPVTTEITEAVPEVSVSPTPEAQTLPSPANTNNQFVTENQIVDAPDNKTTDPPQTEAKPTPLSEITPTPSPETTPETETTPEVAAVAAQTPEASPTPSISPSSIPAEIVRSAAVNEKSNNDTAIAKTQTTTKPLFDPIIINVGKEKSQTSSVSDGDKKAENVSATKIEPAKSEETEPVEPAQSENKPKNKADTKKTESNSNRLRVIVEDKFKTAETGKCELTASQESVWLINGGGSLGILIGFDGKGDASQIKAVSSSPQDVEVSADEEISAASGRAFFILRSVSTKKGAFTVSFNSPCGKKEIQVSVR